MDNPADINQAEQIVHEYGNFLASQEPSIYGIKESLLPYGKEDIKIAIQTIILHIDNDNPDIYDGLTQAYVFLAQFIPDERADIAEQGRQILEQDSQDKEEHDLEVANQAVQTINLIKSEMENLMHEIRLIIQNNSV